MRACADRAELIETYAAIGRQFGQSWAGDDRRLEQPLARFDRDREMMLCVTDRAVIKGGVIAFGDDRVTVRAIGIDGDLRGMGIGRRLLEIVEVVALARDALAITLGAADDARGFYERLGYRGKRTMREKQLPPRGAVRSRRSARLLEQLGDLVVGVPATAASTES